MEPLEQLAEAALQRRIIRNDRELNRIRNYIDANPANWGNDEENR